MKPILLAALLAVPTPAAATGPKLAPPPAVSLGTAPARERELRILQRRIGDLSEEAVALAKTAERAAALDALYALAMATPTGPARLPHPLAGFARVTQANEVQEAGDNARGLALAQEAVTLLRPFRTAYPDFYLQAITSVGWTLTQQGKSSEAAAALGEAAAFAEARFATLPERERSKDGWMSLSNAQFANAQALYRLGQPERAADYQRRSMETRRAGLGPDDPDTISGYYQYAMSLLRAGHAAEAEVYARRAVDATVAHVDPKRASYPRAFAALALVLADNGRRVEALTYMERALEAYRAVFGADNVNTHYAIANLGDTLVGLERYDEAEAVLIDAQAGFATKEGKDSAMAAELLGRAGIVAAAQGRDAEAEARFTRAFAAARVLDPKERTVGATALPQLAGLAVTHGDAAAAQRYARQYRDELLAQDSRPAVALADAELRLAAATPGVDPLPAARALIEAVRRNVAVVETGDLPVAQRAALEVALDVAVRAQDGQLALDAMAILAGSKIAQAGRLVADRLATADPALAVLVREYQDAARAYRLADSVALSATASGEGIAAARRQREAASVALDAARAAIQQRDPRWLETRGVARPDLAAVRAGIGAKEALVGIVPGFAHVYTLVIGPQGMRVERTALGRAALETLVQRLRSSLPTGAYDRAAAVALHDQILTPGNRALLKRADTLRIVPAGRFAAVPFAALLERPVARLDARAPYLVRRYALSIRPDFLSPPVERHSAAIEGRLLAIGAPATLGAPTRVAASVLPAYRYFRSSGGSAASLADLPPLPGAADEVRELAARYGTTRATVLTGADATEERVRALPLPTYSTILFATHGLVAGEMEGVAEPALVLAPSGGSDGLLTASEIAALSLDADWVILSACNTAAGDGAAAPAYSGLAQAFRYAGARSLLLSHWPIRDDAARRLTIATMRAADKGATPAAALRTAMLDLLHDNSLPDHADPYVWAPYIVID